MIFFHGDHPGSSWSSDTDRFVESTLDGLRNPLGHVRDTRNVCYYSFFHVLSPWYGIDRSRGAHWMCREIIWGHVRDTSMVPSYSSLRALRDSPTLIDPAEHTGCAARSSGVMFDRRACCRLIHPCNGHLSGRILIDLVEHTGCAAESSVARVDARK